MVFGGLDSQLRYYEFQLDSAAADYPMTNSTSIHDWPLFKIGGKKPLENIAGIKILEAQIPFSWYVFNSANNTFILTESGQADTLVVIPPGNYTATQMLTALTTALNGASPTPFSYSVTFDSITQKITIWNNAVATSPFAFNFSGRADISPRQLLGFPIGVTISQLFTATGTPKGNYLVSPFVISITGPNYLYVNSLKMGNLTDLFVPKGADTYTGGNGGPQMAKIPVDVQPGGTIIWQDPSPTMFFDLENLSTLSEIDFFLTLGNNSQFPLQLNGQSFSLKVGILVNEFSQSTPSSGGGGNGRVMNRISKR